ncbi:MAG: hypothetical protein LC687_04910 [Actinobacteria bacterium]|nr:hypothetical protein [Actinomycetota bacterium]
MATKYVVYLDTNSLGMEDEETLIFGIFDQTYQIRDAVQESMEEGDDLFVDGASELSVTHLWTIAAFDGPNFKGSTNLADLI